MSLVPASPQTQAVVDHLVKFAAAFPGVEVELQPFVEGGPCEVKADLLPAKKDACDISLLITRGLVVARFGSKARLAAIVGAPKFFGDPAETAWELDMRADYKHLNALLEALAAGKLKPHSAVWAGGRVEPLGAWLELPESKVYVGDTSGFLRGILALFRLVSFRDASFAPWE